MSAVSANVAEQCVGRLCGGTPGPWSEASIRTYMEQFQQLTGTYAAEALATVVIDLVQNWQELFRPPVSEILDRWHVEHTKLMKGHEITDTRIHCDGSGWTDRSGSRLPCRRCNAALAAVYDDPDKFKRYRTGTGLQDLDVGVVRVKGVLRYSDGRQHVDCEPDRHEMPVADMTVARRLMWSGYEAQCDEDGREADRQHFAKWVPVD